MKEVINMENNQYTLEELKEFILGNIEHYEDFAEYSRYNINTTLEEFKDYQERGFIQDITCGTYNGATNTFTPWEANDDNNLIRAIINDIRLSDLYERLEDYVYVEGTRLIDYALTYSEIYNVFTIGNSIYVDLD